MKILKSVVGEVTAKYSTTNTMQKVKITCSQDINDFIKPVFSDFIEYRELFGVVLMNRANNTIGWALISQGGVSGTVVDPKILFQHALLANASAIAIVHNHPSGNLRPSQNDLAITKKIVQGGILLDITILDHIIITAESYYSLADNGQM